jgi:serine/threonine-protein kinase
MQGTTAPSVGDVIAGKYRLEREVGRGGMGIVFAATHLDLRDSVAIRVMSAESAEAVVREARLAAALDHENVGRVLDVGLERGAPYIVMELYEGETLAELLRASSGGLPIDDVRKYVLEACLGLAAAHAAGVIHRDLKPSNLFRERGTNRIKVLDFGVAKALEAPEQVRSPGGVDARADIWSLGVTMYELLCGRLPFVAPASAGVLAAPLQKWRPEVPPHLEKIVLRCLEKDPAARFASADALALALVAPPPRPRGIWLAGIAVVGLGAYFGFDRDAPAPPIAVTPAESRDVATVVDASESPTARSREQNRAHR